MEYIKLIGVLIVVLGFALKLDSILIIFLAAVTTALAGGLGIDGLLEAVRIFPVKKEILRMFQ